MNVLKTLSIIMVASTITNSWLQVNSPLSCMQQGSVVLDMVSMMTAAVLPIIAVANK